MVKLIHGAVYLRLARVEISSRKSVVTKSTSYDREHFSNIDEFNRKLAEHLIRSNNKTMCTPGRKSPLMLTEEKFLAAAES